MTAQDEHDRDLDYLRASYDSRYLVGSVDSDSSIVWDVNRPKPMKTVRTDIADSVRRHLVHPVAPTLVTASWDDGLSAIDLRSGKVVWHRDDLLGIQSIDASAAFPNSIFIGLETPDHLDCDHLRGVIEVDLLNGSTLWFDDQNETTAVYLDAVEPTILVVDIGKSLRIIHRQDGREYSLPSTGQFVLDASLYAGLIAIAEGDAGVRIADARGKVISTYQNHLDDGYCHGVGVALGPDWLRVDDGGSIGTVDPRQGTLKHATPVRSNSWKTCFLNHGEQFVTSSGVIRQTDSGEPIGKLEAK